LLTGRCGVRLIAQVLGQFRTQHSLHQTGFLRLHQALSPRKSSRALRRR
jgi:hypothetical protein